MCLGLLRLSLRLSLCAKPARAARQMKTRPAASPSKFQRVYTARRRARCMRGRALRTSACAWPQAAAGGEKRAINSARAIRELTSREPRLSGSLSNRLRLGLDGRRASLMEMSALLRNLPEGNSAATHQLVMEERLSAH